MAYAVHFRFQWQSHAGVTYRIDILEDGYSGSVVRRALGGSIQLRRNKNGAICGTSLEFDVEAQVDGEFAVLYTPDARAFRVDLYSESTLIWQGFLTPELYSEPYIAPPYNVKVVATDNLGELKLSDYTAQGRVAISTLMSTILSTTGLSLPVHWLSTMRPSEDVEVAAADAPGAVTINLDHMAGKSTMYDVLTKVLDTYHAVIVQHACSWVIARETDLEGLRSGATITAPDGTTFGIADFGSMASVPWWPEGFLSQTVVPAKREKKIIAPNAWLANLMPDTPDSSSHASYVEPTDGSSPYWLLHPWNSSLQYQTASIAFRSPWLDWSPSSDLVLMMAIQTIGVLSGHKQNVLTAKIRVRVNVYLNGASAYRYVTPDGTLSATAVDALEIDNRYRDAPESFSIGIPVKSQMAEVGYTKLQEIYVTLTTTDEKDGISNVYLFDTNVNYPEQNQGYQVTCVLNNDARGAADTVEIAAADNANKAVEDVFVTNGMKYTSGGTSIEEWESGNILSMPMLEFLARDYCLSIAVPRLRMEGRLNVPAGEAMPLLFRGGGLIYWPETWDWNLVDDATDVSMLSLPASAITVTSVTRTAEGSDGFAGGSYSGGGGGGGANYFEESGTGVKLMDDYTVLQAKGFEALNNGDVKGTWKGVAIGVAYGGLGLNSVGDAYSMLFVNSSNGYSFLAPNDAATKKFLSQTGNGSGFQSNAPLWSAIGVGDISVTGDSYALIYVNSSSKMAALAPNSDTTKKFLTQTGNGGGFASNAPAWGTIGIADIAPGSVDAYSLLYVNGSSKIVALSPNFAAAKKVLTQTGNGGGFASNAPTWGTLGVTDIMGSTGVGSASQPIYYTGSTFAAVTGIANDYLTNSKVTIMGSDVSLGGSIDTFSGAGTFNGAIVINNTLQVGNPTTNRNMQLHGELRFNGLSNVYLNYIAANAGIHCSTGFYTDSYISASSDARLKKNLKDVHISLADIADAPAVEFDWVDKNKGQGAGSIAQYWQNVLPLNVHCWEDGSLSMEYGNIALISAIAIARRVCELEREIKELRNRLPQ